MVLLGFANALTEPLTEFLVRDLTSDIDLALKREDIGVHPTSIAFAQNGNGDLSEAEVVEWQIERRDDKVTHSRLV